MLLSLTADQEFFRDTTARFLDEHASPAELRRLRDDPTGFDEKYWRGGADLGWTSLLVDEQHGGGTISGAGLADLALIAYEFGRHAAAGPLAATNIAAAALSDAGSDSPLPGVLAGTAIVTWATGAEVTADGDGFVVRGVARPVESAAAAESILVTGATTQVLVARNAGGVTVEPMETVDLTRRFDAVTFDDVRVSCDAIVNADIEKQRRFACVLACAESVGAMQAAFDLTVEWAFDRYSFGRPLASYQALKHRFADMKMWLEASHAVSADATAAVAAGTPEAAELVSAAKAYIGHYGSELLHDCVQLHGGIGVTFDHDLHLFLRRHTVNRALYGTPSEHRQRIADLAEQREPA